MKHKERVAGFGLMELLIALAIVAILATLALPSYRTQMQQGRRLDAISSLLSIRVAQEKWRASHTSYASLDDLGWSSGTSLEGHYQLRLSEHSASGFMLIAQPVTGGPQQDDRCGSFALDQRGPVMTGTYAGADCWRR
ncbi:MAG: prepilin-type N-terminal cleavage/methylation domain-containing protein [Gammaproteobacteria bacterium]|nr:prepilin-type N-terminal cleavage/methylation domain-containing protein [Gammaproteobacteria bacterium]